MDIMPWYLFSAIPAGNCNSVRTGIVLIGVKPRLLPVLLVALITALASYFIRALPLPPGINILLQLPILILLITYIFKIPLTFAMLASFPGSYLCYPDGNGI